MKSMLAGLAMKVLEFVIEQILTEERIEEKKDQILSWIEKIVTDSGNEIDDALVLPIIEVLKD